MQSDSEIIVLDKTDLEKIKEMQTSRVYVPAPLPQDTLLIEVLNRVPFLTRFLREMNEAGKASSSLVTLMSNAPSAEVLEAAKGFQYVGLTLRSINFIRIPLIYLASFILGKEPPMTLSNNAKWLYSATLLTLTIVALTLPVTGPILSITIAALMLGESIFTFGRLLYDTRQNKKTLASNEELLATEKMNWQRNAQELQLAIDCNDLKKIEKLYGAYQSHTNEMQKLTDQKYILEEKIKIESEMMNRAVGIGFFALTVIGAVTTLFFPPVGIPILIASGLGSGAYTLGMFAAPYVGRIGNWLTTTKAPPVDGASPGDVDQLAEREEPVLKVEDPSLHKESSAQMLQALGGVDFHTVSPKQSPAIQHPALEVSSQSPSAHAELEAQITCRPKP